MADSTTEAPTTQAPNTKANRTMPKFVFTESSEATIKVANDDTLRLLYGTRTNEAATGVMMTAINALGRACEIHRPFIASLAVEMEPTDAIEAMLVTQMAATHVAVTSMSQKMMDATSPGIREAYERSLTRLSRTYLAQMDAFKRYRAKAQQVVRVERVTVHQGGQAIVGPVTHGGRASDEK